MGIHVVSDAGTVSKQETYSQLMYEIQRRMVDIEMLRDQKKPIHEPVADMVILAEKLCELEGIDKSFISDRRDEVERDLE